MDVDRLTFGDLASIDDRTFLVPRGTPGRAGLLARFVRESERLPCLPYAHCVFAEDLPIVRALGTRVCVAVGFPDGSEAAVTAREAGEARLLGADELDMVLDWRAYKAGDTERVDRGVRSVVRLGLPVKLILETSELTPGEIVDLCTRANAWGVAFVKTSTGLRGGATVEALRIMRAHFTRGVKISGGVSVENYTGLL